jgi:integrase
MRAKHPALPLQRTVKRARLYTVGEFYLVQPGEPKHDPPYRDYGICWNDKAARQTRRLGTGETDFEQAKDALKEHALKHGDGEHKDELILQSLERYYLAYACDLASAENVKNTIEYVARFWADKMVSQLDATAQKYFTTKLRGLGIADATIVRHLGVISPAISYAIQFKHLPKRLAFVYLEKRHWGARTHLVKRKSIAASKRGLSPEEWGRLFDSAMVLGRHYVRYLICAIATHGRPTAITELTGRQVNLEYRTVDLNQPGRVQSKKHRPVLPLAPTFAKWLVAWAVAPDERIITTQSGRPMRRHRFVERLIAHAQMPDCNPYTFRHAIASYLAGSGIDKWERKRFLGHTVVDGGPTDDYTHYDPRYLRHAAEAIECLFEAIAPHTAFNLLQVVLDDQGDPELLWNSQPVGFHEERAATRLCGTLPRVTTRGDTEGAGSGAPGTGTAHPPLTQTISLRLDASESPTVVRTWEARGRGDLGGSLLSMKTTYFPEKSSMLMRGAGAERRHVQDEERVSNTTVTSIKTETESACCVDASLLDVIS